MRKQLNGPKRVSRDQSPIPAPIEIENIFQTKNGKNLETMGMWVGPSALHVSAQLGTPRFFVFLIQWWGFAGPGPRSPGGHPSQRVCPPAPFVSPEAPSWGLSKGGATAKCPILRPFRSNCVPLVGVSFFWRNFPAPRGSDGPFRSKFGPSRCFLGAVRAGVPLDSESPAP